MTLLDIVEPHTAGDPMNSRKWLNCRLRDIQERLQAHAVSLPVISRLLKAHDYHLRSNRKEREGPQKPERDQHFSTSMLNGQPMQRVGNLGSA